MFLIRRCKRAKFEILFPTGPRGDTAHEESRQEIFFEKNRHVVADSVAVAVENL